MFCKYCGSLVSGTTCSKCGKATVLFAHSTELETLLDKSKAPDQETYDEGFSKGYRKGLSEGYQNGIKEVPEKIVVREGPSEITVKPSSKKLLVILCLTALITGAVASGLIANKMGYQAGYTKGTSEGEAQVKTLAAEFDSKYEEAKEAGRKEGENKAQKDYEQELARLKEAPAPTPAPSEETSVPTTQILFSREKNEGTYSEDVKKIQIRLHSLGFLKGKRDGFYGKATENAVKEFQKQKMITGKVDSHTYNALFPEESIISAFENDEKQDISPKKETPEPTGTNTQSTKTEEKPAGYAADPKKGKTESVENTAGSEDKDTAAPEPGTDSEESEKNEENQTETTPNPAKTREEETEIDKEQTKPEEDTEREGNNP